MFGIDRDEHSGVATHARERRQAPAPPDCAAEGRHLTSEHSPVDGVQSARQRWTARHPAPRVSVPPSGRLHARVDRRSASDLVVASEAGTAQFREAPAVQEFGTPVDRARQRRIARKEEIDRLPCPDLGGLEASAGVVSRGDHPCQEQHFDCIGRLLGNRARQHPVDTLALGAPFQARIGSLHGIRTQPGSSRNTTDAPGNASRLRAPLATNLRASARACDAGRTIRDLRDPLMKQERRARRRADRAGPIALSTAVYHRLAGCPGDQAGAAGRPAPQVPVAGTESVYGASTEAAAMTGCSCRLAAAIWPLT